MFLDNVWLIAALWVGLALAASLISIRLGISVALIEILLGMIGGNFLGLVELPWVTFVAGFGAIFLTFLAGAEVDPYVLKNKFKESFSIGFLSFLLPFLAAFAYAYYVGGWGLDASLICGIALSTTSVAVVYAVMVETGLNRTELGRIILAACFITNLGTVVALGLFFAHFDVWMAVFVGASVGVFALMPRLTPRFAQRYGGRIAQAEIKFFFFILLLLGGLALKAGSEAVLPAYILGLTVAGFMMSRQELLHQLRVIAFAFFTPFYFLKAGLYVSLPAVAGSLFLIIILLGVKVAAKFAGVWPVVRLFQYSLRESMYITLLMSTGLTFGIISALFGLNHGLISQEQYTILVTVEIASAVVPTLIAQTWFRPRVKAAAGREQG